MNRKPMAVIAVYPTCIGVENAVEAFRDAGFQSVDVSLLLPEKMIADDLFIGEATDTFENAAPGKTIVATIDGPLGWLEEIGPVEIPGERKFIAAGPITEALEVGSLDKSSGPTAAALISFGTPENEACDYEAKILQGGALVSVHCENAETAERARRLHCDVGGTNIFSTSRREADCGKLKRSLSQWAGR
jgi:hypothetical protein